MKKIVLTLIGMIAVTCSLLPLTNIENAKKVHASGGQWWARNVLYKADFLLENFNRLIYPIGISTNAKQVVIGKNDWLFLGDEYQDTISIKRHGGSHVDAEVIKKIAQNSALWKAYFSTHGVQAFHVIVGADKDSIYPEFLPQWAQAHGNSITTQLLQNTSEGVYVDTRPALFDAKSQFAEPLYYRTDTHWNSIGGWVAYTALARHIEKNDVTIRWLQFNEIQPVVLNDKQGGDLTKFLHMRKKFSEPDFAIKIKGTQSFDIKSMDYHTQELLYSGKNIAIDTPERPILVHSKNALNKKRVLWLRDSFGTGMSAYMTATFSEVLQSQYITVNAQQIMTMVEEFKPDYVFITVVERGARVEWFKQVIPLNTH